MICSAIFFPHSFQTPDLWFHLSTFNICCLQSCGMFKCPLANFRCVAIFLLDKRIFLHEVLPSRAPFLLNVICRFINKDMLFHVRDVGKVFSLNSCVQAFYRVCTPLYAIPLPVEVVNCILIVGLPIALLCEAWCTFLEIKYIYIWCGVLFNNAPFANPQIPQYRLIYWTPG